MDLDTTTRRGSHDAILRKFSEGEVDILLGTQMVAKGLDFSRVTLVGVISADTQMLLPDFRSSERTFQLLTQVAGRAGRSALAGEVVIQTYQPQHDSLKHVLTHNYRGFFEEEISFRKELDYPPYSRIVMLELRGEQESEVRRHALELAALIRRNNPHWSMLGPATAAIAKLKGLYRWHIVIKNSKKTDPSGQRLQSALRGVLQAYKTTGSGKSRSVRLIIDIDPVGMM
jgi:primosomal protein N' (replication factor Y)